MKWLVLLFLWGLALGRLSFWATERDGARALCSRVFASSKKIEAYAEGLGGKDFNGREVLRDATLWVRATEIRWPAPVVLFGGGGLVSGQRVRIKGTLSCSLPPVNPARNEDGLFLFGLPPLALAPLEIKRLAGPVPFSLRWLIQFEAWVDSSFRSFRRLHGIVRATWFGDLGALPPGIVSLYREGGLLHALALSGQHALALAILLGGFLRLAASFLRARLVSSSLLAMGYRHLHRALPFLTSLLLLWSSRGCPPAKRAAAMFGFLLLLRVRRLYLGPVQLTASSAALLMLWDPSLVASVGFLLSACATAMLTAVPVRSGGWRQYAVMAIAMPILLMPITAFFFSRLSFFSPFWNLILSGLWSVVVIPAAFLLPPLVALTPSVVSRCLLPGLEALTEKLLATQMELEGIVSSAVSWVPCPTWLEVALLEGLLVTLCLFFFAKFTPDSSR